MLVFDSVQDSTTTGSPTFPISTVTSSTNSIASSPTTSVTPPHSSNSKNNVVGAAVGGAVGGLLLIIALCAGCVYLRRRSNSRNSGVRIIIAESPEPSMHEVTTPLMIPAPFSYALSPQTTSEVSEPTSITTMAEKTGTTNPLLN